MTKRVRRRGGARAAAQAGRLNPGKMARSALLLGVLGGILAFAIALLVPMMRPSVRVFEEGSGVGELVEPDSREAQLRILAALGPDDEPFDVVIVGGGSAGAGATVEAAGRGLKVALFEADDFGCGTSSRSTKLLHGGVRYLRKALRKFDGGQFHLVKEALAERAVCLRQAPHLAHAQAILTPLYAWRDAPLQLYDWIAYPQLHSSGFISSSRARSQFPQLKAEGLKGAVVYYDAMFDDARFNLGLVVAAQQAGAVALNHAPVVAITHTAKGKVSGVEFQDVLTGQRIAVRSKVVVNAAGPFADEIRLLDNPDAKKVMVASAGSHIVLPARFCPEHTGLLIPRTEDRRVAFLLPWQGHTLAGTTDAPCKVTHNPRPREAEIQYILRTINRYFAHNVSRSDVLAAWSGIRPLKRAEGAGETAQVSRKWTTYRRMAADVVAEILRVGGLEAQPAVPSSHVVLLPGAAQYNKKYAAVLARESGLPADVAAQLVSCYGDQAVHVAALAAEDSRLKERLVPGHPYIAAQVVQAARREHARTIVDVLERRVRLGVLDTRAARAAVPAVGALLAEELGWSEQARADEEEAALVELADTVEE